ncbi:hypothetical protein LINGRAHAP2_LOCUS17978, partial [Linum grandiflorum]
MNVTVAYHVGGKFVTKNHDLVYEGGTVIVIDDIDPDVINLFDLEVVIKIQVSSGCRTQMYYKVPKEHGVDAFRLIYNDETVRDMLYLYKNMEVYDIYVEQGAENLNFGVGGSNSNVARDDDQPGDDYNDNDDTDFEIGSWISEEDREELEEVKKKAEEARKKLKRGIKYAISDDDNNDIGDDSEEFNSDEIGYYEDTDSEDEVADHGVRMKEPLTRYNPNTDKPFFSLGMTFSDAEDVREAIKKHAITERKDVKFVKNEPKRIRLKCKWRGCRWIFFASHNKRFNLMQLKKYKSHSCSEHYKNKFVNPKLIAERYKRQIRSNPKWKNKDIREMVREDFGADVTHMQCSRAKAIVLHKTLRCYKEEYALLRTYAEAILRTNPGSTVKIKVDVDNPEQQPLFHRMYICFDALKKGFLAGCRKIISLDGSFMK